MTCNTKLKITLRYLASAETLKSLEHLFRAPHKTISTLLPNVLKQTKMSDDAITTCESDEKRNR